MSKNVRVTLELPNSALALLKAKAALARWTNWLPSYGGDESPPPLDIGALVAWLVYLEARGARPDEIHAATPIEWRDADSPIVIHEERRVYQDGELVGSGS